MPPTELENTRRWPVGGNVGKVSFEYAELEMSFGQADNGESSPVLSIWRSSVFMQQLIYKSK